VSLVTFPMLAEARVAAKSDRHEAEIWRSLTQVFEEARLAWAQRV
jgi:phage head maturation protease